MWVDTSSAVQMLFISYDIYKLYRGFCNLLNYFVKFSTSDWGMAKQFVATPPATSFEYEFFDESLGSLRTVSTSSGNMDPWIEPGSLKLTHRIGRGAFGDVWLATHHQSSEDYDECHEVAAKMLPPIREDYIKTVLERFHELYFQCQGMSRVCWLHGISILNGRVRLRDYSLYSLYGRSLASYLDIGMLLIYLFMLTDMRHHELL